MEAPSSSASEQRGRPIDVEACDGSCLDIAGASLTGGGSSNDDGGHGRGTTNQGEPSREPNSSEDGTPTRLLVELVCDDAATNAKVVKDKEGQGAMSPTAPTASDDLRLEKKQLAAGRHELMESLFPAQHQPISSGGPTSTRARTGTSSARTPPSAMRVARQQQSRPGVVAVNRAAPPSKEELAHVQLEETDSTMVGRHQVVTSLFDTQHEACTTTSYLHRQASGDDTQELPQQQPPAPAQHGAYRVRGINQTSSAFATSTAFQDSFMADSYFMDHQHRSSMLPETLPEDYATNPVHRRLSQLMRAELVVEESTQELQQADDFDAQAAEQREQDRKRFNARAMGGGLVLLALLVLVVVFSLLPRDDGDTASSTAEPLATGMEAMGTLAPTTYQDYVLSLLPNMTVQAILEDPSSPQAMAHQWLLDDISISNNASTAALMSDVQMVQRFALATLYFATGGSKWTTSKGWLNYNVHECDWHHRQSFALTHAVAHLYPGYHKGFLVNVTKQCNEEGLYQHLWLDQNNLAGTLPEEFFMLMTNLQSLSLARNRLGGPISPSIAKLTELQGLVITFLEKAGEIPTEIGLLTDLHILSLANNNLAGSIPSELWHLKNLDSLNLNGNPGLKGTIPTEIGGLSKLRWLIMNSGNFSGTIPSEIGLLQSSMEWLVLYENHFSGGLPAEIGKLSKLQLLSLYENNFNGKIPSELGLANHLYLLSLRTNRFFGSIPTELGLLTNLFVTLNLRENELYGSVPSELGLLSNVQELELLGNEFFGQIPSELGQLNRVGHLTLANNSFWGTVPQELSALQQSLYTLNLEGNPLLSGIVPDALCQLNGTCIGSALDPCEGPFGLSFDCTPSLCGCHCSCAAGGRQ